MMVIFVFAWLGFLVTGPHSMINPGWNWIEITSGGEKMGELLKRASSALPANRVFWAGKNQNFRISVNNRDPEQFSVLKQSRQQRQEGTADVDQLKAISQPYEELLVPAGESLFIPRLSNVYVFFAGSIAITAMILPGISGSYLLLILGSYFSVLYTLKGFIELLIAGVFSIPHFTFLCLFGTGAVIGLLLFVRLLSYLLAHWETPTMAALTGLLIGCLRGVWPFRQTLEGVPRNIWPAVWGTTEIWALIFFCVGFIGVLALSLLSYRLEK